MASAKQLELFGPEWSRNILQTALELFVKRYERDHSRAAHYRLTYDHELRLATLEVSDENYEVVGLEYYDV